MCGRINMQSPRSINWDMGTLCLIRGACYSPPPPLVLLGSYNSLFSHELKTLVKNNLHKTWDTLQLTKLNEALQPCSPISTYAKDCKRTWTVKHLAELQHMTGGGLFILLRHTWHTENLTERIWHFYVNGFESITAMKVYNPFGLCRIPPSLQLVLLLLLSCPSLMTRQARQAPRRIQHRQCVKGFSYAHCNCASFNTPLRAETKAAIYTP